MSAWPRIAALAMLLLAMVLLIIWQWLPALLLLPSAGGLVAWESQNARTRSSRNSNGGLK
ncbi:hypothetical protein ACT3UQ_04200 [Glutamicibacter sp. AOP12-B1-11]|uniref:hypothetical protein n=1 Tax=Glutamicibacter sp. AOP12-B1-11 TaxID=3457725 RepID=UPI004034B444